MIYKNITKYSGYVGRLYDGSLFLHWMCGKDLFILSIAFIIALNSGDSFLFCLIFILNPFLLFNLPLNFNYLFLFSPIIYLSLNNLYDKISLGFILLLLRKSLYLRLILFSLTFLLFTYTTFDHISINFIIFTSYILYICYKYRNVKWNYLNLIYTITPLVVILPFLYLVWDIVNIPFTISFVYDLLFVGSTGIVYMDPFGNYPGESSGQSSQGGTGGDSGGGGGGGQPPRNDWEYFGFKSDDNTNKHSYDSRGHLYEDSDEKHNYLFDEKGRPYYKYLTYFKGPICDYSALKAKYEASVDPLIEEDITKFQKEKVILKELVELDDKIISKQSEMRSEDNLQTVRDLFRERSSFIKLYNKKQIEFQDSSNVKYNWSERRDE